MSAAPATVLERVHAAARERELAGPTLAAYRRTWLKLVAWTTASGIDLGALPREEARGYYEDLMGNRSASHPTTNTAMCHLMPRLYAAMVKF